MANPIVHIEIGCTDKEKTGRFFAELFGWNLSDEGPAYGFAAGSNIELSGHIIELAKEWGIYNTFYVQVDDIEACLDKAATLGGKTLVPARDVPGAGRFAWLAAPEGNIVGLYTPTG